MESPLFSVIIPTYNRSDLITRCLDSLTLQTVQDFEVIICDDGSTDNTDQVVKNYKESLNLKYIKIPNWGGPARPRNTAIQNAQGEWLCFLDSDDWWFPNKLKSILPFLPSSDVVYHDLELYNTNGNQGRMGSRQVSCPVFLDLLRMNNPIYLSGTAVRADLFRKCGGFSEDRNIVAAEDYAAWLSLAKVTEHFTYVPEVLGAYWFVGECINLSASPRKYLLDQYVLEKHLPSVQAHDVKMVRQSRMFQIGRSVHRSGSFSAALSCYRSTYFGPNLIISIKAFYLTLLCLLRVTR